MEKEEDALHFASCRELSYIDYHQGAVQKQQSIAIEVMTPLYLDGARVSTLISSPEDVDILAAGYCLAEGKVASGRGLSGVSLHDDAAWVTTEEGQRAVRKDEPFHPISAQRLCSYGGLLDSLSTAIIRLTESMKALWCPAITSSFIRKILVATTFSTDCVGLLNWAISTSARPFWYSAAAFLNRLSKRSTVWASASWPRGHCRPA